MATDYGWYHRDFESERVDAQTIVRPWMGLEFGNVRTAMDRIWPIDTGIAVIRRLTSSDCRGTSH